jgi:proline dehydrogenase
VAYPHKADVDRNYLELVETALSRARYTAIATHDARIVERAIRLAQERGLPERGRFEFQLLYGIAGPLARSLAQRGYRVRLSIPFGPYWFPYLMRRLAERPANVGFFIRGALGRG